MHVGCQNKLRRHCISQINILYGEGYKDCYPEKSSDLCIHCIHYKNFQF